ncbi:ribosome-binding factor A [[Clostridium] ultunense Esp]|uniref:30S ribosome-binding factor RbfA n=1 Tax=Thermicanus aegyptius TaxID=94009 RepID=UPI0002B7054A|nr:30S ribosome-binding factor RbfA [Thermicanus aegyptius]CCQ98078.1 ribosome-binding factor A [[Clostridium] ultunense Esp]
MSKVRTNRIAEQIKKELGFLFQRELKDPRIGFVTVMGVEVSSDLSQAKIFVSVMGSEEEKKETLKTLEKAQGFLRSEIGKRIELRHVPELIFKLDTSIDYGDRIERILSGLKEEKSHEKS